MVASEGIDACLPAKMPYVTVRHADPQRDAAACAAAYAPAVLDGHASFETEPVGAKAMAARIEAASLTHPWLVHEQEATVTGYAYAAPFHERAAYRWAATVAVYVHPDHQGQGAARALYTALLDLLRRQRLRWALAGIGLPNAASVALHERFGFVRVGVYPEIGYKTGAWRDVGWWQLELAPPAPGEPPEPLGPQRL